MLISVLKSKLHQARVTDKNTLYMGSITIDRELREFAGIEPASSVVVAGSFDRVEIWNPATYRRQAEQGGALIRGAAE